MGRNCKYFRECKSPAVVRVPYAGLSLCRDHFLEFVEKRVERVVERYHFLEHSEAKHEPWLVAMSGGKDSQVLATILSRRMVGRVDLEGVYVDVGVTPEGYTAESRRVVERTCRELGIPLRVVDLRAEYGFSMDDVHRMNQHRGRGRGARRGGRKGKRATRTDCSACGIVKRYLINKTAVELGVMKVATGHHLTDEATTVLGNFLSMNLDLLARGRPWSERKSVPGGPPTAVLVPRVKPLYEVPEDEVALYAYHAGIEHVGVQCAYSAEASSLALKAHVVELERERPGMMLGLVRGYQKRFLPAFREGLRIGGEGATPGEGTAPLVACSECGYPTTVPVCAFCKLRRQVLEFVDSRPA
ncbi:MAG: hypothetical protein ACTSU5_03975 [Promethearchaeota archaeon]